MFFPIEVAQQPLPTGLGLSPYPQRPLICIVPEGPYGLGNACAMTRKSIEATAKYFIWGIFVLFLLVLFKVLQMMGFFA